MQTADLSISISLYLYISISNQRGGKSSWYDTLWRLVRGGIGGENTELQLVHWGTNRIILSNFAPLFT